MGRRAYIDANVFIYFLEEDPRWLATTSAIFASARRQEFLAVTADAVVSEVMVLPYRSRDEERISRVRSFFTLPGFLEVRSHARADFDEAARIQAEWRVRMVDALHLGTARNAGCDCLITNDARMPSIPGLDVLSLQDFEELRG